MHRAPAALPAALRARLLQRTPGVGQFALLDGALDQRLSDRLARGDAPPSRCLWSAEPASALGQVAPWLVELPPEPAGRASFVDALSPAGCPVFVAAPQPLAPLWRHLRQLAVVPGPEGRPLHFRFWDSRVLAAALPLLSAAQRQEFFGPIDSFQIVGEIQCVVYERSRVDGELTTTCVA